MSDKKDSFQITIKQGMEHHSNLMDIYDENDFFYSLDKFYRKTGYQFVIVIDEWDSVFRERKEDKDGQKHYLDFLRDWMKDKAYIALAYMTGILPIKKYGKHSALNMFDEYSMTLPSQMAPMLDSLRKKYGACVRNGGWSIQNWKTGMMVTDCQMPCLPG